MHVNECRRRYASIHGNQLLSTWPEVSSTRNRYLSHARNIKLASERPRDAGVTRDTVAGKHRVSAFSSCCSSLFVGERVDADVGIKNNRGVRAACVKLKISLCFIVYATLTRGYQPLRRRTVCLNESRKRNKEENR